MSEVLGPSVKTTTASEHAFISRPTGPTNIRSLLRWGRYPGCKKATGSPEWFRQRHLAQMSFQEQLGLLEIFWRHRSA
jgi:hypothetical protein